MTMVQQLWVKRIARSAAALFLLGLAAQADLNEPFGLPTVAAPEGPLWVTWRKLQSDMQSEQPTIARCRAEPSACGSSAALRFIAIVNEGLGKEGIIRIGRINRAANFALQAVGVGASRDLRRKWVSPLAALDAGIGDCKEFAVLKYAALNDSGIALEDLRLIIGGVDSAREYHVVVAVRDAGRWYILDNRSLAVLESREFSDFLPIFALDRRGVRQIDLPSSPKVAGPPCPRLPA